MTQLVYSQDSAPEAARPILAGAQKKYGFVPNLLGMMAEAPALLNGYTTLSQIFESSSFDATERQIVLLTVSFENGCEYCVAAHSVIATMQQVPSEIVQAIRLGQPIADEKLQALRLFTSAVVTSRGWPTPEQQAAFRAVGYSQRQILEVVLGVGLKTLSNYANHIAQTPLDGAFQEARWQKTS